MLPWGGHVHPFFPEGVSEIELLLISFRLYPQTLPLNFGGDTSPDTPPKLSTPLCLTKNHVLVPFDFGNTAATCIQVYDSYCYHCTVCRLFRRSVLDLQWLLLMPTLAMSLVLLFLLGFPLANILPVTLTNKRR